jgi:predicted nucleic acid-binding protein
MATTLFTRIANWLRSATQSRTNWVIGAVVLYGLYRKLRQYTKMQHSELLQAPNALRQPIRLSQFPSFIKNQQGLWLFTSIWPVPQPRVRF